MADNQATTPDTLLSIIVPFYNSKVKCKDLLASLSNLDGQRVQVILVDDGSTDQTLETLREFANRSTFDVIVVSQENRGPGGARNAGFLRSSGKFVWFVDSDDEIDAGVLAYLSANSLSQIDFIDFDYLTRGSVRNSMGLPSGVYDVDPGMRMLLIGNFGRLCTKIFSREFLIRNNVKYPEYCFYEDNALTYTLPLVTSRFIKEESVAYIHHEEHPSVTRGSVTTEAINPRFFDRMGTACLGFSMAQNLIVSDSERNELVRKFHRHYLLTTTVAIIWRRAVRNFFLVCRVMRNFRSDARKLDVRVRFYDELPPSRKYRFVFLLLWAFSCVLPSQESFFRAVRIRAWGRDFPWRHIRL